MDFLSDECLNDNLRISEAFVGESERRNNPDRMNCDGFTDGRKFQGL